MSEPATTEPIFPPVDDGTEVNPIQVEGGTESDESFNDDTDVDKAHVQQPQPTPRQYSPPKADANTFKSQQAFLESLQPIEIENVEEDRRRCPICWKNFGEDSDPGFDNSEQPVQLRCNHVFGQKCLANLFGTPEDFRLSLHPLRFLPDDRGYLLGKMLFDYHRGHIASFRNEVELFQRLLTEIELHPIGTPSNFGKYWHTILLMVLRHANENMTEITLMENAVVLDCGPPSPKKNTVSDYAIPAQHLNASSSGLNQTLAGAGSPLPLPSAIPPTWGATPSSSFASVSSIYQGHIPNGSVLPYPFQPSTSTHPHVPPPTFAPAYAFAHPNVHSGVTEQVDTYLMSTQSSSDPSKTWEAALTTETNLDKLSALHKQFADQKKALFQDMSKKNMEAFKAQLGLEQEQRDKMQRAQLERQRRARDRKTLLAQKLVDVLARYKAEFVMVTRLPGQQHPLDHPPKQIHVSKVVHAHSHLLTSYEINPPSVLPSFGNDDDTDDEDASRFEGSTMIILRSVCTNCKPPEGGYPTLPTPTEVTWRDFRKTPDSCPLCHKVLFVINAFLR